DRKLRERRLPVSGPVCEISSKVSSKFFVSAGQMGCLKLDLRVCRFAVCENCTDLSIERYRENMPLTCNDAALRACVCDVRRVARAWLSEPAKRGLAARHSAPLRACQAFPRVHGYSRR